jgi:pyruvyl transferase EpsO
MHTSSDFQLCTPQDIKRYLHKALSHIPDFQRCALLDYPSYYNIGDHLIWLGNLFYISQIRQAKIDYTCSKDNFSNSEFAKSSKEGPIFLSGGGSFGDLWPGFQSFREKIIRENNQRPIVILPQTIHFSVQENLIKSARIFNQHPDVTIFARDDRSFSTAKDAFSNCKVFKAPDTAFQMIDLPHTDLKPPQSGRILYLCRQDREMDYRFKPEKLKVDNLDVADWIAFSWMNKLPEGWVYIPGLVRLVREVWQRGLKTPNEWLSRQSWQWFHPYSHIFNKLHHPSWHRNSWGQMHSGIYQLQRYDLVITNRLHVHILCLILNIPHVLLPGSYYKISDFHKTWTSQISFCRFVENVDEIPEAVDYLRQRPSF